MQFELTFLLYASGHSPALLWRLQYQWERVPKIPRRRVEIKLQTYSLIIKTRPFTFEMNAWPRISSGHVGSSIHSGRNSASLVTHATASATSHRWLASTICRRRVLLSHLHFPTSHIVSAVWITRMLSGPIILRMRPHLRISSCMSAPTFTLNFVHPWARASEQSCTHTKHIIVATLQQNANTRPTNKQKHLSELLVGVT